MAIYDELERLTKLKEDGAISEEEFNKEKQNILNRNDNTGKTNSAESNEDIVKKYTEKIQNEKKQTNKKTIKICLIVFVLAIIICFMPAVIISIKSKVERKETSNDNYISNTNKTSSSENTVYTQKVNTELNLNDVQLNTTFYNLNEMNEVTERVAKCGLAYVYNLSPNFIWSQIKITGADGYGRFWVVINYVKSSTSEMGTVAGVMVWVKDINDYNKMGYYFSGSPMAGSNGWGTPIK